MGVHELHLKLPSMTVNCSFYSLPFRLILKIKVSVNQSHRFIGTHLILFGFPADPLAEEWLPRFDGLSVLDPTRSSVMDSSRPSMLDPNKQFHCYKCERSYMTKGALQRHLKYECQNYRLFTCPVCGKTFKRSCHVKNHVWSVHSMNPNIAPSYPEHPVPYESTGLVKTTRKRPSPKKSKSEEIKST
ncbi:hypothetical protein J6590_002358 [Homalodisca vitripennis]|nr:hypothetical protein J6590_002358 [Homalodisca vitripennis]